MEGEREGNSWFGTIIEDLESVWLEADKFVQEEIEAVSANVKQLWSEFIQDMFDQPAKDETEQTNNQTAGDEPQLEEIPVPDIKDEACGHCATNMAASDISDSLDQEEEREQEQDDEASKSKNNRAELDDALNYDNARFLNHDEEESRKFLMDMLSSLRSRGRSDLAAKVEKLLAGCSLMNEPNDSFDDEDEGSDCISDSYASEEDEEESHDFLGEDEIYDTSDEEEIYDTSDEDKDIVFHLNKEKGTICMQDKEGGKNRVSVSDVSEVDEEGSRYFSPSRSFKEEREDEEGSDCISGSDVSEEKDESSEDISSSDASEEDEEGTSDFLGEKEVREIPDGDESWDEDISCYVEREEGIINSVQAPQTEETEKGSDGSDAAEGAAGRNDLSESEDSVFFEAEWEFV